MSYERKNIAAMEGYVSGEQPENPDTIKLNTNENPYPPSPAVDEIIRTFTAASLRRYPPASALAFRTIAAERFGLTPDEVIATRGGDELLRLVITTFVEPGESIGMSDPTYSLYSVLAQVQDCPITTVPLAPDWSLPGDFAQRMNEAGVKLTLVVNPHAPSGCLVPVAELRALARDLEGILLVDEAYIDFAPAGSDSIALVREFDNVILLRTLSKGYSLAGLRFGFGLGAPGLINPMLTKTRDSYNLDLFGQRIAETALQDQAYAQDTWNKVIEERENLRKALLPLGLTSPISATNFLLVDVPPSGDKSANGLYEYLKERHILIRYFNTDRLRDKVRISVGTPQENATLLEQIRQYCERDE